MAALHPVDSAVPTHYAFSDETHHNVGRYRGVGMVSLPASNHARFEAELTKLFSDSKLQEFKWTDLSSAQHRFAALQMIDWAFPKLLTHSIRIDVLTWDTHDSRHQICGRDDTANLARMYYHLFKNVLRDKWPDDSRWMLLPDENSAIEWDAMNSFLGRAAVRVDRQRELSEQHRWQSRIVTEFSIQRISPCRSHEHVLIQLADLTVGLAVYSRTHYLRYERWRENQHGQGRLGFMQETEIPLSRSDRERCLVLCELDVRCKKAQLGVSLKSFKGLRSPKAISALNFWWYEPQVEQDKAPTGEVPE